MMHISKIAAELLAFNRRPSSCMTRAVAVQMLGDDGLAEAIRRRWVVPTDSFELSVTPMGQLLDDMNVAANGQQGDVNVGDAVIVTADGETYQGVVQSVMPDKRLNISFPDNRRPRQVRPYGQNEVNRVAKPNVNVPSNMKPVGPAGKPAGQPTVPPPEA